MRAQRERLRDLPQITLPCQGSHARRSTSRPLQQKLLHDELFKLGICKLVFSTLLYTFEVYFNANECYLIIDHVLNDRYGVVLVFSVRNKTF